MPNSLYDDEDELHDHTGPEISVGTTSIVGIFFVLVLICAAFFGIGYTLGRRQGAAQIPPVQSQPQTATPVAATAASSTPKPAPGSPAAAPASAAPVSVPSPSATPDSAATPAPAKSTPASTAPAPATGILVQIAALTHEEDANNEVAELQKRATTS